MGDMVTADMALVKAVTDTITADMATVTAGTGTITAAMAMPVVAMATGAAGTIKSMVATVMVTAGTAMETADTEVTATQNIQVQVTVTKVIPRVIQQGLHTVTKATVDGTNYFAQISFYELITVIF